MVVSAVSRPRRSRGLRRLAGLAVAAIVIWAVVHGYAARQPAYCGSACYGYHSTHSQAPHPLRHLHRVLTRGKR